MKEHRIDYDPKYPERESEAKRIVNDFLTNVPLGSFQMTQQPDFTGIIAEFDTNGKSRKYVELLIPLRSYLDD